MINVFKKININIHKSYQTRNFWQWLNIVFNSIDEDRIKLLGPDRTCAEWLLRNGASVKWTTSDEYLKDYNMLPSENTSVHIKEVDATDSSISHYGFPHFSGCKHIDKIILHKCTYLENPALPLLSSIHQSLKYLQVSSCGNITEIGLSSLTKLDHLETLIVGDLPYLKDKEGILKKLNEELPKCKILFK